MKRFCFRQVIALPPPRGGGSPSIISYCPQSIQTPNRASLFRTPNRAPLLRKLYRDIPETTPVRLLFDLNLHFPRTVLLLHGLRFFRDCGIVWVLAGNLLRLINTCRGSARLGTWTGGEPPQDGQPQSLAFYRAVSMRMPPTFFTSRSMACIPFEIVGYYEAFKAVAPPAD